MAGIGIKQNPDEIASAGLYFIFTLMWLRNKIMTN